MMAKVSPIIEIEHLQNRLGGRLVHEDVNLEVFPKEIVAIIGGSGCGKTTLLRSILMLQPFTAGTIKVFGEEVSRLRGASLQSLLRRWGVMFQSGALFSSMTVLENVMFPMREFTELDEKTRQHFALLKLALSGLELSAAVKYPSELSGGMRKRAAMARAIAMDPELLFLDEPNTGLDPQSAGALDDLILDLRDNLGLTFLMVTHDLDTLWRVPDKVVFLGEGKVLACATMPELFENDHPAIRAYFSGPRSAQKRVVQEQGG